MIYWVGDGQHMRGFVYLPLLEVFLGLFLFVCTAVVAYLYFKYNGFSRASVVNVDFLLVLLIFIFCFACGRKLTFQKLSVTRDNEKNICVFYSSLREKISFTLPIGDIGLLTMSVAEEQTNKELEQLIILSEGKRYEFYASVSEKEIKSLVNAITKLLNTKN